MEIHGSCHCGNIRYTLDWPGEPPAIPGRACTCSYCTRHGAVWTAHPEAALAVRIGGASQVIRYAFETKTAEFLACTGCGIVPVCISSIDGRDHAVVNVNTFDDATIPVEHTRVSFDGEDEGQRLARRRERWIGRVRFDA